MSRLIDYCPSSDDECSRLDMSGPREARKPIAQNASPRKILIPKTSATNLTRRVRRLGGSSTPSANPLFLPWNAQKSINAEDLSQQSPTRSPLKSRRSLAAFRSTKLEESDEDDSLLPIAHSRRPRRQRPSSIYCDDDSENTIAEEQMSSPKTRSRGAPKPVLIDEAASDNSKEFRGPRSGISNDSNVNPVPKAGVIQDDESTVFHTASEGSSESDDDSASEFEDDGSSDESFVIAAQPRVGSRAPREQRQTAPKQQLLRKTIGTREASAKEVSVKRDSHYQASDLSDALGKLQIASSHSDSELNLERVDGDSITSTPSNAPRPSGLVSPRKLSRIPMTPHRASVDAFWNQDFIDDWNDAHSPTKPVLRFITDPDAKVSSVKTSQSKAVKRTFDAQKRSLAEAFLHELDDEITKGEISQLAQSTGGVKLVWTKTLNTTAGRANWRRETTRTKSASGETVSVDHKHHASIELAEKVIDTEDKLLNVLAHEFCHLANFMVSGITNNPHGKEFKAWATKCSRAFGESRGIQVTTKHTYEIDFKYVWECTECGFEYKRHSKSIDPVRHRCGSCKSSLKQTKPKPRGIGSAAGKGTSKPSDYQLFVKEHLKRVREENPGSPHKDVMRIVADRWAVAKKGHSDASKVDQVEAAVEQMALVTLDD